MFTAHSTIWSTHQNFFCLHSRRPYCQRQSGASKGRRARIPRNRASAQVRTCPGGRGAGKEGPCLWSEGCRPLGPCGSAEHHQDGAWHGLHHPDGAAWLRDREKPTQLPLLLQWGPGQFVAEDTRRSICARNVRSPDDFDHRVSAVGLCVTGAHAGEVHRDRAGDARMHHLSTRVQRAASSAECGCPGGKRESESESESEREREREGKREQNVGGGGNQRVMRCGSKKVYIS